ncbi:MAG: hypothetical protein K6E95_09165 [Lachnospiraceae bacterium]|nr:hypothetical protein [Lachnospiraceae bacterium]
MGKIINTLRYGKAKTKTFIISVFVLMVAAIVIGIIGINGMNIILLGVSMVLFIICIVMVFKLEGATADLGRDDAPADTAAGKRSPGKTMKGATGESYGKTLRETEPGAGGAGLPEERAQEKGTGRIPEERAQEKGAGRLSETGGEDDRETGGSRRKDAEERLRKTLRGKSRGPKTIRAQLEKKLLLEIIKANKRSSVLNKKTYVKRMKTAPTKQNNAYVNRGGRQNDPERDEMPERDRGRIREESDAQRDEVPERVSRSERKTDYKTYTKNEVKRLRKIYKIPKDACRIIIDSCKSLAIDHAPALFWVKKGRIYLLVFEESARCETLPMVNTKVSYKKNLREDEIIKYNSMREMGVYKEFEDMMPTFSIHGGAAGNEYYKNLYVLGKDLEITPRSLRALLTQFDFKIEVFDSLGIKGNYSEYFQKAYEQRIMWTDGVISQGQYQNNIRDILQSMVDDEAIIRYDFMDDLAKMVHHRLITDEYAEFYRNKRL